MMIVGTVMAVANGTVLPLMCIVFGEMTDSLINSAATSINMTGSEFSDLFMSEQK